MRVRDSQTLQRALRRAANYKTIGNIPFLLLTHLRLQNQISHHHSKWRQASLHYFTPEDVGSRFPRNFDVNNVKTVKLEYAQSAQWKLALKLVLKKRTF